MPQKGPGGRSTPCWGIPSRTACRPSSTMRRFVLTRRNAVYVARRVDADECGEVLRDLALAGGGGNVTLPHKELVVPFLDRWTPAVSATGACNTFWADDGEVWGDNTDVEGFNGSWRSALSGMESGLRDPLSVLVLGAGGAARAVLFGLLIPWRDCGFCCGTAPAARLGVWCDTSAIPYARCFGLAHCRARRCCKHDIGRAVWGRYADRSGRTRQGPAGVDRLGVRVRRHAALPRCEGLVHRRDRWAGHARAPGGGVSGTMVRGAAAARGHERVLP